MDGLQVGRGRCIKLVLEKNSGDYVVQGKIQVNYILTIKWSNGQGGETQVWFFADALNRITIESKLFYFSPSPSGLHITQFKDSRSYSISFDHGGFDWLCDSFRQLQSGFSWNFTRFENPRKLTLSLDSNRYGRFTCLRSYDKGISTTIIVPEGRNEQGFGLFYMTLLRHLDLLKEVKNGALQSCSEDLGNICSYTSDKYDFENTESIPFLLFHADLVDYGYYTTFDPWSPLRETSSIFEASVVGTDVGLNPGEIPKVTPLTVSVEGTMDSSNKEASHSNEQREQNNSAQKADIQGSTITLDMSSSDLNSSSSKEITNCSKKNVKENDNVFSKRKVVGKKTTISYPSLQDLITQFKADEMSLDKRMKPQTLVQSVGFSSSTSSVTSRGLVDQNDLMEATEDCSFTPVISRRNKKKLAIQATSMQTRSQLRLKA
ncbi:unnamed protein product [Cuscuta epithymum]|uniref:Uncharacterized protein n=1 Tax=Cuscuta epithymum TaxID=186058 RepID=A0AAV0C0A2_9ASTE|nr:unnamed protein product [Cuscuta epithymum]